MKWLMEFPHSDYYSLNVLWNFQTVNKTHEMAYGISRKIVLVTIWLMESPDSEIFSRNGKWNFQIMIPDLL